MRNIEQIEAELLAISGKEAGIGFSVFGDVYWSLNGHLRYLKDMDIDDENSYFLLSSSDDREGIRFTARDVKCIKDVKGTKVIILAPPHLLD